MSEGVIKMGTTMSFFHILNKGFSPVELHEKMENFSAAKPSKADKVLESLLSPDPSQKMREQVDADTADLYEILGGGVRSQPNRTVIAYRESATWLPFFKERLCEGYIASSKDTTKLSVIFGAPVIAFAVFDSDILFVSYSDAINGITYDYVKPNFEEFEEFDTDLYSTAFPEFLLEFCSQEDLRAAWDSPDEVFADNRMEQIAQLIKTELIYDSSHIPEGYQGIYAT